MTSFECQNSRMARLEGLFPSFFYKSHKPSCCKHRQNRGTHSDGSRSSGGGVRAAKPTRGLGIITAHARQTEKDTKIENN